MSTTRPPERLPTKLILGSLLAFVSQNIIQLIILLFFDLQKEIFIILTTVPLAFFLIFLLVAFTRVMGEKKAAAANGKKSAFSAARSKVTPVHGSTPLERITNDDTMEVGEQAELVSRLVTNRHIKSKKAVMNDIHNRSIMAKLKLQSRVAIRRKSSAAAQSTGRSIDKPGLAPPAATGTGTGIRSATTGSTDEKKKEQNNYNGPLALLDTANLLRDFEKRDQDSDGSIDCSELLTWMRELLPEMKITEAAAQSIVSAHDESNDNVLQYEELEGWVAQFAQLSQKKRNKLKR